MSDENAKDTERGASTGPRAVERAGARKDGQLIASDAADRLIDELVPGDLDWRGLVRAYPVPAALVAAAGGFFLGRQHGSALLTAAAAFAAGEVSRSLLAVLDEESEPGEAG